MEAEGQYGKTAMSFDEDLIKAAIKASPEFEEKAKNRKPKHLTLNVDPELRKEVFDETVGQMDKLGLVGKSKRTP